MALNSIRNLVKTFSLLSILLLTVATFSSPSLALEARDTYVILDKASSAKAGDLRVESVGGTILKKYPAVKARSALLTAKQASVLSSIPGVLVDKNQVVTIAGTQSNPPSWGLDRIDQVNLPLDRSFSYEDSEQGQGVSAYVIDTGLLTTHQEFTGRVAGGFSSISDGRGVTDCAGHGTHVSGTIGGSSVGIARQVTLVPIRVLDCTGSGTLDGLVAGVNWVVANHAANEPAVANLSLGFSAIVSSADALIQAMVDDGITTVVAAGNSNTDACTNSPGRAPAAITVAATGPTDARSYYSNYGSCVDIFAPGGDANFTSGQIYSAYSSSNTSYATMQGTSMASPHVAGVAARYLTTHRSATPAATRSALLAAASAGKVANPLGSPNYLLYSAPTGFNATSFTVTGPSSGLSSATSEAFTITPNGLLTGTITLALSGASATASKTSFVFADSRNPQTFTITPSEIGDVTLTLTDNAGLTDPAPVIYSSLSAATSYAASPNSGSLDGNVGLPMAFSVTPNGAFTGTINLTLGGVSATASQTSFAFTNSSASQSFTVTAAAEGTLTLTFSNSGSLSNPGVISINVARPLPVVTNISTGSGAAGTTIRLTGSNFTDAAMVTVGGSAVAGFTVVNDSTIDAVVATGSNSGSLRVYRGAISGLPSTATFTVTNPLPTIASGNGWASPTSGLRVGSSVTLNGTNLNRVTGVFVGGTKQAARFRVLSNSQLVFGIPAGATNGTVAVTYSSSPTLTSTVTSTKSLSIGSGLIAPTVTSLSATSGMAGAAVVINGTNLAGATSVTFNNQSARFTVLSATQILAAVPDATITGLVKVTTAGGTSSNTAAGTSFTRTAGSVTPTLTSVSPGFGSVGATITLVGTNLAGITSLTLNGVAVTNIRVNSISGSTFTVTVTVPSGVVAGTGNLIVSVVGGGSTASLANGFTVY